jgi:hypothetical protein
MLDLQDERPLDIEVNDEFAMDRHMPNLFQCIHGSATILVG